MNFRQIFIMTEEDLPKAGMYHCQITENTGGYFHFNPEDKDDIDFWVGNVMWYLEPIPEAKEKPVYVDWEEMAYKISTYFRTHDIITAKFLGKLFDSYSEPLAISINNSKVKESAEEWLNKNYHEFMIHWRNTGRKDSFIYKMLEEYASLKVFDNEDRWQEYHDKRIKEIYASQFNSKVVMPSDEVIMAKSQEFHNIHGGYHPDFAKGAKWIKSQIKQR